MHIRVKAPGGPLRALYTANMHPCIGQVTVAIGDTIRAARRAKGMKQIALAAAAGVTQGQISRLENGETLNPTHDTLARIAEALDMPLTELIGHTPVLPVVDDDRVAVPIVQIPAHAGADWTWQPTGETITVERDLARGRSLQVIKVEGTCMYPRVEPGDLVIFDHWSRDPKDGEMVVVTRDGQHHVRWARIRRPGALPELVDNFGNQFPTAGTVLEGVVTEVRAVGPRRRDWHDIDDTDPEAETE
jgi:transcriptional regulator with XRE-family HTH domain